MGHSTPFAQVIEKKKKTENRNNTAPKRIHILIDHFASTLLYLYLEKLVSPYIGSQKRA
jgi:hypothetical protein